MAQELTQAAEQAPAVPVQSDAAIISMIERAARDPQVDIEKMERLFQMHAAAEARRAKTAFLAAFSLLQSELPAAVRAGTGHNSKKYARYEDLIEVLRPMLKLHGFSLSHRVDTSSNQIKVTGILGHRDGHSEETQFSAPPDTSGNKTPIHAIASTISYGKRYVTLTLTGIATEGEDDDAKRATAKTPITEEQVMALREMIEATNSDEKGFCAYMKTERLSDLPAEHYERAVAVLKRKAGGK